MQNNQEDLYNINNIPTSEEEKLEITPEIIESNLIAQREYLLQQFNNPIEVFALQSEHVGKLSKDELLDGIKNLQKELSGFKTNSSFDKTFKDKEIAELKDCYMQLFKLRFTSYGNYARIQSTKDYSANSETKPKINFITKL
jgi:hypothetical protein